MAFTVNVFKTVSFTAVVVNHQLDGISSDFSCNSTHNPLDLWKKMFASEYVITLDEMPSLK